MKSLNKLLGILGSLFLILGISACTEDAEYTPATQLANAQVYFPTTMASQVNLKNDATSFDIELNRVKADEAATVELTVIDKSGLFTIPSSASFAAGEDVAKITIGYDPEQLGFDNFQDITISIADESFTTPYGTASYSFKAGIPSPWKSLGLATFSDTYLFEHSYQVDLQQNELQPNIYRLVDPYSEGLKAEGFTTNGDQSEYLTFKILKVGDKLGDVEITTDGLVYFDSACTGFFNTSNDYNKNVDIHHPGDFTKYQSENDWAHNIVKKYEADGTPGIVQLAPFYYMDGLGGWDMTQKDGIITIVFPGVVIKDYSASVTYKGRFTNIDGDNFAIADITLGDDVENGKVVMIEGDDINAAISGILDGSLETTEMTSSGTVNIPSNYNGLCSIVVITYGDNEAQEVGYTSFEFSSGSAQWKSLGLATYTDDIVGPAYGEALQTYQVEIQESSDKPGIYRLVNPYGEAFPYNQPGDWDNSKNYYMEINAQDPHGVYIELQNTGLNWGNGNIYVYSMAANYLAQGNTLEDIKAAGYCGTLINGIITFPSKSLLFGFIEEDAENLYYANVNGAFKIVLPEATDTNTARHNKTIMKISNNVLHRENFSPNNNGLNKKLKFGLASSKEYFVNVK